MFSTYREVLDDKFCINKINGPVLPGSWYSLLKKITNPAFPFTFCPAAPKTIPKGMYCKHDHNF